MQGDVPADAMMPLDRSLNTRPQRFCPYRPYRTNDGMGKVSRVAQKLAKDHFDLPNRAVQFGLTKQLDV